MANALTKIEGSRWPIRLGPAMADLPDDRWRLFCFYAVEYGGAHGAGAKAARAAGFANPDSSAEVFASTAYRLLHDPRIVAAINELTAMQTRALAPEALNVVREIMRDQTHKDRLKAANAVLDRTDPTVQKSEVKIEHVDPEQQAIAYLKHLISIGTPEDALVREFGTAGLARYRGKLAEQAKPVIETEYSEVEPEQSEDDGQEWCAMS